MKILQVGKYYPPVSGGMERLVCELSEGLARRGHTVHVVVSSRDGRAAREDRRGVSIAKLKSFGRLLSQPLIQGLREEISRFEPDVVHYHLPNPLAIYQGWRRDLPTCLTIHAIVDGWRRKIDRLISEAFVRDSQTLIFSSQMTAELWSAPRLSEGRAKDLAKIKIIPFGFRFDYLEQAGQPKEVKQDPLLALFVGRLVPYKGIKTLLHAMKQVDGKLAIVGTGPLAGSLESSIRSFGLDGKVSIVGEIPDHELGDWYRRCSVYVQPSISIAEAYGISMLEAMRLGRPVVSTDLPTGVQLVNRHLVTGLVARPGDPRSLASSINCLLRDQCLAKQLGKNAFDHQVHFRPDAMIDAHLDIYNGLIAGRQNKQNTSTNL